jgi:hypothetical protein
MFRYITILLVVVGVVGFLWPTIAEGARLARNRFKKAYQIEGEEDPVGKERKEP